MSENFLKFKKRRNAIRVSRAAMIGACAGLCTGGAWLILSKLAVIEFEPISSLLVGIGICLIVGGLVFLLDGKSDKAFAEELDGRFDLKARVQTMVACVGEDGDMIALQRQDAENALSKIPASAYKFKKWWIYAIALLLSACVLAGGLLVPNKRDYVAPEEITPFELSDLQEAGLKELIKYVNNSALEEEFRNPMATELEDLLERLRGISTQTDMRAALAESMAVLVDITYRSSSEAEMLNILWDTDDLYLKHLAKVLDTSKWSSPDWGDFAEKLANYSATLMGENDKSEDALIGTSRLRGALDGAIRKAEIAFGPSIVEPTDELYLAINGLIFNDTDGFVWLISATEGMDDASAREALVAILDAHSKELFDALSLMRGNALVGEYAMTRLGSLFLVPVPEFERAEFVKNNESVSGENGADDDDNDENGTHDGGVGEGSVFGSKDLVLDPLTGNYVEYGELIDKYYAVMYEKLNGGSYTEEQKVIIEKYFALLYSGIEKEEGK